MRIIKIVTLVIWSFLLLGNIAFSQKQTSKQRTKPKINTNQMKIDSAKIINQMKIDSIKIIEKAYDEYLLAVSSHSDDSIIQIIKSSLDKVQNMELVNKLKTFYLVNTSNAIPWDSLNKVYIGSCEMGGEKYECGVELYAFNPLIFKEESSKAAMVGSKRYYHPDDGKLLLFDWTEFDGFIVKCSTSSPYSSYYKKIYALALIKQEGLFFNKDVIVLKKGFKLKKSK